MILSELCVKPSVSLVVKLTTESTEVCTSVLYRMRGSKIKRHVQRLNIIGIFINLNVFRD